MATIAGAGTGGPTARFPDLFATTPDTRTLEEKSKGDPLPAPAPLVPEETNQITTFEAPSTGTSFTLPELETAFRDQATLLGNRQSAETRVLQDNLTLSEKAARDSAGVLDASQAASDEIRRQQLEILGGVQGQILKANEAIALSDSNNPFDRFKLYLMQQSDPSYTAEGNTARLAYLKAASDALGTQGIIQQGAFAEQIQKIQTDLGLATMTGENELRMLSTAEAQGQERIQMAKDLQATRMGILQNQRTIQDLALSNMTLEQAKAAQATASQSNTGSAPIGNGVDAPLAMINERVDALENRDYLKKVLKINEGDLALGEMTLPQLALLKQQALTDKSGMATTSTGVQVSLAKIQDRETALMNQDANALAAQYNQLTIMQALDAKTKEKLLQTYSLPELTQLQKNGGVAADGTKFDLSMVNQVRTLMAAGQETATQDQFTMLTMSDPSSAFLATDSMLTQIQKSTDPTSGLGRTIEAQKKLMSQAAYLADPTRNPTAADFALASSVLNTITETTNKAVTAEAKRRSGGDKNLEQAYEHTLRGEAVPAELVRTALIEKVTKGLPATEWLDSRQHGILVNTYRAEKARLDSEAIAAGEFRPDPATIKQMAAEVAVNAVKMDAASGISDEVLALQATVADNPLAMAGMSASEILQITKHSENIGLQNYISGNNISSTDAQVILNGGGTDEQKIAVAQYQTAALYAELDKKQAGLGAAYTDWWNSPKRSEMIQNYAAAKQGTYKDLTTGATGYSLLMPDMQGIFGTYANTLADGEAGMIQEQLQKQHAEYVTFGGDPAMQQVFLLDRDKTLTDAERQSAMSTVIQPIIEQGKQMGMNSPQQMTQYIETSLRQLEPEDPNQRKLVNKILKNRDATIEILDSFITISQQAVAARSRTMQNAAGPLFGNILASGISMWNEGQGVEAFNRSVGEFPWWKNGN